MPFGHRHADRHRQPLPQRAGGALDARQLEILGVPRAGAVQLTEVADVLDRRARIAGQMQQRVNEHRAMPGRQHEAIPVRPVRRGGIELQIITEQHGGDIGHAHRHTGMARIRPLHRIH
jgi:hypothetical protein